MSVPKAVVVPATTQHTATVIFAHGLGDTGFGWLILAETLKDAMPHVKWIFPHSPRRPVTANGGMVMPAWFDIKSWSSEDEDEAGILRASESLKSLISGEIDSGIPSKRIVIGGFSQGGVLALVSGLSEARRLAGMLILSAFIPLRFSLRERLSIYASSLPIFWGHGTADPVIPIEAVRRSVAYLSEIMAILVVEGQAKDKLLLSFKEYTGLGHSLNDQELSDVGEWLRQLVY